METDIVARITADTKGFEKGFDVVERKMKEVLTLGKKLQTELSGMLESARGESGYGFSDEELDSYKEVAKSLSLANKELGLIKKNLEEAGSAESQFKKEMNKLHAQAIKDNNLFDTNKNKAAQDQKTAFDMMVKEQQTRLKFLAKQDLISKKMQDFKPLQGGESYSFKEKLGKEELNKFKELHQEMKGIQEVYKITTKTQEKNGAGITRWTTKEKYAVSNTKRFRMELLSTMFAGMALTKALDGQIKKVRELIGAEELHSAAMTSLYLPATLQLSEITNEFDLMLLNLGENERAFIGWGGIVLNWTGQVAMSLSQLGLAAQGLETLGILGPIKGAFGKIGAIGGIGSKIGGILGGAAGSRTGSAGLPSGKLMETTFKKFSGSFVKVFKGMGNSLSSLGEFGSFSIAQTLWDKISEFGAALSGALAWAGAKVVSLFASMGIGDKLSAIWTGLGGLLKGVADKIGGWLEVTGITGALKSGAATIANFISGAATKVWDWLAGSAVVQALISGAGKIGEFLTGVGEKVYGWLESAAGSFTSGLISLKNFLVDVGTKVYGWLEGAATKFSDGLTTIGKFITGLADKIKGWLDSTGITSTLSTALSTVTGAITKLFNKIAEKIAASAAGQAIGGFASGLGGGVVAGGGAILGKLGLGAFAGAGGLGAGLVGTGGLLAGAIAGWGIGQMFRHEMGGAWWDPENPFGIETTGVGMGPRSPDWVSLGLQKDDPRGGWNNASGEQLLAAAAHNGASNSTLEKMMKALYGWDVDVTSVTRRAMLEDYARLFALGGIVTKPTLGMVGEAGPEAVIPLDKFGDMGTTININIDAKIANDMDLRELANKISNIISVNQRSSSLI